MPRGGLYEEKVASYLAGLSPEARRMILRRLEGSAAARDRTDPAAADGAAAPTAFRPDAEVAIPPPSAIAGLPPLPDLPAAPPPPAPPEVPPAYVRVEGRALFFEPFEPFVVAERLSQRQPGWLARSSFDGIWAHLRREVMPERIGPWDSAQDLPEPDAVVIRTSTIPDLRRAAFAALARIDAAAEVDQRLMQRLASRVGGDAAYADLRDMIRMRPRLAVVERTLRRLPDPLVASEATERATAREIAAHLEAPGQAGDAVWLAAALGLRAPNGGTLARLAVIIAGAGDPAALRRGAAQAFIEAALSVAERHLQRFRLGLLTNQDLPALLAELKGFHDTVRGATLAAPIEEDRLWHQRLSVLRSEISEPLAGVIEGVVPSIRYALRGDRWSKPQDIDRREAMRAAGLLAAARRFRDSLAVNAAVQRLWPLVEQALQTYGRLALDDLHKAKDDERSDLLAATQTLVDIAEVIHGESHAALLRRSRERAARP